MSRSGYVDEMEDSLAYGRWRAQVKSSIRGARGQAFLRKAIVALDSIESKTLIAGELIDAEGECCTIGAVCKMQGINVEGVDYSDTHEVALIAGISRQMVAEIEFMNDEYGDVDEHPQRRWDRMRRWVVSNIIPDVTKEEKK